VSDDQARLETSSFFDDWAASYHRQSVRRDFQTRRDRFVDAARWAITSSTGRPPICLDLGCGPGSITVALAELGFSAVGVDASQAMINAAEITAAEWRATQAADATGRCRFVCSDIVAFLGDFDGHADFIMSSSVLEYLDSPLEVIELVAERLTDSGIFAVSIPNQASLLRRIEPILLLRKAADKRYTRHWKHRITVQEVISAGRASRLRQIGVSYFGDLEFAGRTLLGRYADHERLGMMAMIQFGRAHTSVS
jgi:2-polyprenyl-3-methyl-5-hydroxy-6-metoxy-1,4-benzoquinol methylase